MKSVIHLEQIRRLMNSEGCITRKSVWDESVTDWWCGWRTPRCTRFSVSTHMSSFCLASSCSMLTGDGDGGVSHPEIPISECKPFCHKKFKISKRFYLF
jgi:hypothetical protein